ncbi:MAG: DUF177 domain-containing protein [Bacteroidetes bacterium]|nr:DUF177 domain-containing protein [Bacteroidota bacterium]
MKINISGLSEGSHQYVLTEPADGMGLESYFTGDVTATITLEKSIHQILASVNASVKGVFICDRCAEEFQETVDTRYTAVYSWERTEEREEDDDFYLLGKEDNIIDLTASVRDYLQLAVPVKLLCKRNCELPAHVRAAEPETDPRWEQLKLLKQTEKN